MPDTCCVGGCPNVGTHGGVIRYYAMPQITERKGEEIQQLSQVRREQWIANIRVKRPEWEPHKSSKICSFHFISGQKADILDVKNPDWVPTLRMGVTEDENTELQRPIFVRRIQALISKSPPAIAPQEGKRNMHRTLLNKAPHAKEDSSVPMIIRVRPPTHQRWEQARAILGLEDDDALARYFLNHFEAGCQSVQMKPTGEDSEDKEMDDADTTSVSCLQEQNVDDIIDIPFSEKDNLSISKSCKTNKNANDVIEVLFTQKDTLLASTDSSTGKGETDSDLVPSALQTSQPISKEASTASGDIARDIIKMPPAQQQSNQPASKDVNRLVASSVADVLTSERSSQLVPKDSNVKVLATDPLSMQHTTPPVNNLTNVGAVAAKPGVVYMSLTQQANQTSMQDSHTTSAGIPITNSTSQLPNTLSTTGDANSPISNIGTHRTLNKPVWYSCGCQKRFLCGELLEKHKLAVHGEVDKYKCKQCCITYRTRNGLTKHVARDHQGPPFICSHCGDPFNEVHLFVKHQSKHYDKSPKLLSCDSCGRIFHDANSLLRHKQDVHVKSEDAGDRQGFQCDHCGQVYKSKNALSRHESTSCKNNKQSQPFSCLRCKEGFNDSSSLVKHLKMHDGEMEEEGRDAIITSTPSGTKASAAAKPLDLSFTQQPNPIPTQSSHTSAGILITNSTSQLPNTPNTTGNANSPISNIATHRTLTNKPVWYSCGCQKRFLCGELLEKHKLAVHGEVDKYKCKQCCITYRTRNGLTKHVARDHQGPPFICSHCGDPFNEVHLFVKHQSKHYDKSPKLLSCDSCGRLFHDASSLLRHKQDVHVETEEGTDNHRGFQCDHCGQVYKSKCALSRHESTSCKNNKKSLPFSCLRCKEGFKDSSSLVKHLKMHDGEKKEETDAIIIGSCGCGKSFTNGKALERHRCTQRQKCPHCSKTFRRSYNLKQHIAVTHSTDKPRFICKICGRVYNRVNNLRSHTKSHLTSERKCWPCKHCSKVYQGKQDLKEHLRQHTGQLLLCSYCGKEFTTRKILRHHELIHRNDRRYRCSICHKAYYDSYKLKCHMFTHTGEKPLKCKYCGKGFVYSSARCLHQKTQHGDVEIKMEKSDRETKQQESDESKGQIPSSLLEDVQKVLMSI